MSWTASGSEVTLGENSMVNGLESFVFATDPNPDVKVEQERQLEEAKVAVAELIESGVIGEGPFYVHIYGHANPGHQPIKGWANDALTLTIGNKKKLPE